jgi:flagellar hook-associated protein 3 FlgL
VKALARALDPPAARPQALASATASLDTAFNSLQTIVGDAGAQANRLSSVSENLAALKTNLTTFQSDLEDVDLETAMTELTSRQLAYQAALLATSKVTGMSLADYLR